MNIKIIGKLLAVILLLMAIYTFDWNDLNKIIVSILLSLSAATILIEDVKSEFWQNLRKFLRQANLALAVFLLLKIVFFG